jgi:endonuclease-8
MGCAASPSGVDDVPEGDSVHGHARRIREKLLGRRLTRLAGTEPAVRRRANDLRGAEITLVEAVGKHLIIEFEGGWALHVHLGMSGRWRFGPPSGTKGDGPARVVLETTGWSARCDGAPTVELDRTPLIRQSVARLGPDLIDRDVDLAEILTRLRSTAQTRSLSAALLDQTIAAGIGNVYRNDVLFEAGLHPDRQVGTVDDETMRWVFERAAKQLRANVGRHRTTTGGRRPGTETYVYGRAGRACRRCGGRIEYSSSGDPARDTYWCPTCQPA